jgi:hypothetical protein
VRSFSVLVRSVLVAASIVATTAATSELGRAAPPEPPADDGAKVDGAVLSAVDDGGSTTFWVRLADQADLSAASAIEDWAERGAYVVEQLQRTAAASQAPVRAELDARGTKYTSFWVTNSLRVRGGEALVDKLAANPAVEAILAPVSYDVPDPVEATDGSRGVDAVEWGIDRIRADDVWTQRGVRGEGIVVANIDTGVQFDHPALVRQYRGNLGSGSFDHNYSWFDPARGAATRPRRPATTTVTARTRWARWSATTVPGTRSASPRVPAGSPPRAASRRAAATPRCWPRQSSSSPRPTWRATTRGPIYARTWSTTPGVATPATRGSSTWYGPGGRRGCSPSSPTATRDPAAARPDPPATMPRATRPARSTSTA